jgi:hypothetical protein
MKTTFGLGNLAFSIAVFAALGLVFWLCACLQNAYVPQSRTGSEPSSRIPRILRACIYGRPFVP